MERVRTENKTDKQLWSTGEVKMAIFTDKTVGHGDGGEQYHKERRRLGN